MNGNSRHAAVLALLFMAGVSSAAIPPPPSTVGITQGSGKSALPLIKKGFQLLQDNDLKGARPLFEDAIDAPDFVLLSSGVRYGTLLSTGMIEDQLGHHQRAYELLTRATAYKQADADAWLGRLFSAYYIDDQTDAARCLTVVAKRWPDRLNDLMPAAAGTLHNAMQVAHKDAVDREMLDALFDAGWPGTADGMDFLWKDLALIHLARGDMARATKVALRIQQPSVIMGMLVDKRFDAIVHEHPRAFDIKRALAARIKQFQALWKAHPDRLKDLVRLQDAYLSAGDFDRVMAVSNAAVATAENGEGGKTYSDFDAQYNWVLDYRARALEDQGKWQAALRERLRAARVPENGGLNVSQAINLGDTYADLGEPDKAADAISQIGAMSKYGRMQLEEVKLRIAFDRHDQPSIDKHMAYIRKHRDEAMLTYQNALLLHGDLDEAAALLIKRLRDPQERGQALAEMQHYLPVKLTPLEQRIEAQRREIDARPDVLAALHKVGRVGHFPITPIPH